MLSSKWSHHIEKFGNFSEIFHVSTTLYLQFVALSYSCHIYVRVVIWANKALITWIHACGYVCGYISFKCDPHSFELLLVAYFIMIITNYGLRFLKLENLSSVVAHLLGCLRPGTFFYNIGSNMLPSDSFMSNLYSHLGYSIWEFQAL